MQKKVAMQNGNLKNKIKICHNMGNQSRWDYINQYPLLVSPSGYAGLNL